MDGISGTNQTYTFARKADEPDINTAAPPHKKARLDSCQHLSSENMDIEDISDSQTQNKKPDEPSYDVFFINNDQELEKLLPYLKQQHPCSFISLLRSPEDIDTDNLTDCIEVKEPNNVTSCDGHLFRATSESPVVLVLDYRNIHPSRRAELNWLFDKEPRLGNRVIRGNVHIVSLVANNMLPGSGNNTDKPGPDFWRRINKPDNHWSTAELPGFQQDVSLSGELDKRVPEYSVSEHSKQKKGKIIEIDLFGKNWRTELFGSPGIDDQNAIVFHQGRLAEIKENTRIILKGAPWQDPQFALHIWSVLHSGQFEANGTLKQLPTDIQWCRKPISENDLETMKQCVVFAPDVPVDHNVAIINEDNFNACMQEAVVTSQGRIVKSDVFKEWYKDSVGIRITSPLSQSQWLRLLRRLGTFEGKVFQIYIDNSQEQPENFRGITASVPELTPARGVRLILSPELTYEAGQEAGQEAGKEAGKENVLAPSVDIVVPPDCSLEKMAFDTGIESLNKGLFRQHETEFLAALRTGKKIRLRGLESSPVLTRQLETLLLPHPYLLLGGKKEYFANAQIDLIWPPGAKSSSPVWEQVINKAKTVTDNKAGIALQPPPEFDQVLKMLEKLPKAQRTPATPPCSIDDVKYKVSLQAKVEQKLDGAGQLTSRHWRKAINSVLLKEYRGNQEVYSFLKVHTSRLLKDRQKTLTPWINSDDIRQWLLAHPTPDQAMIEAHFWQLMRQVDPVLFESLPDQYMSIMDSSAYQSSLKRLTAILVCCAMPERQAELAFSLKVSPEEMSKVRELLCGCDHHSRQLTKQLENFLYSLDEQCLAGKPLSDQAQELASGILKIRNSELSDRQKTEHAFKLLTGVFSSGSNAINNPPLEQLAKILISNTGEIDWHYWEERRLKRFASKVAERKNPVSVITGPPGASKSFTASKIARLSNPQRTPTIFTVCPETTTEDLFGREEPQQSVPKQPPGEGSVAINDTCTRFIDGPLTQWAKERSDRPLVLVIDEANLAKPEIWDCLKGMYEQPPCLYHYGRRIPLTDEAHPELMHRIIMTGNPDHFSGRQMNAFLRSRAPQLYYKPLAEAFQSEKVLKPELKRLLPEEKYQELGQKTCDAIMQLVNQYRPLLPEHEFTPRDLTDIAARMARYLSVTEVDQVTFEQLSAVAWQSVADTLAGAVDAEKRWRFVALEAWFNARFQPDDRVVRRFLQQFDDFYTNWQLHQLSIEQQPGMQRFDLSNNSVKHLAKQLWLELDRATFEKNQDSPHHGRHATLVEGPAGRGKDRLLDLLIHEWNRQFGTRHEVYSVTGGIQNWGALRKAIQSAREKGHWLLVPELNMLKTEYLEGAMNDVLTGSATQGFHLFATVNPVSFSGRQALSPALQSRFTTVKIGDYNVSDLEQIASVLITDSDQGQQVCHWHYQLLQRLKEKKLPILPTVGNMSELAQELNLIAQPVSRKELKKLFTRHYQLFMRCAKVSVDDLCQSSEKKGVQGETESLPELTQWLNLSFGIMLPRPVSAIKGPATSCDLSEGLLMLNTHLDKSQWQPKAVESIVKHLWSRAGLPLESPDDHDILFTACYKRWQQKFYDQITAGTNIKGSQPFRMTRAESETLGLKNNRPYLERLETLLNQPPSPWHLHQFRQALLAPVVSDEAPPEPMNTEPMNTEPMNTEPMNTEPQVTTDSCPPANIYKIDGETKIKKRHRELKKIFIKNGPIGVRKDVMELKVLTNGTALSQSVNWGYFGFEVMTPNFVDQSGMSATYKQDVGRADMTLVSGSWQALPGLWPQEKVVAVYVTPECEIEIVRDRFTQLHLVRAKNKDSAKAVTIYYVLEPEEHKGIDASQPLKSSNRVMPACPRALKDGLDQLFREQPELQGKLQGETADDTIARLTQYCESFKADETLGEKSDVNLLIRLIKSQQGSCRHRSEAFYALALYFGIAVRMISSKCHRWVEVSADGGRIWEKRDLGGASHVDSTIETLSVNNISVRKSIKLSRSVIEKILGGANNKTGSVAKIFGVSEAQILSFLSGDDHSQLTIAEDIDPEKLEKELIYSKDPDLFMTGLSMLQESGRFNPGKHYFLYDKLATMLSHNGPMTPEVLCDFLHNAYANLETANDQDWHAFVTRLMSSIYLKNKISITKDKAEDKQAQEQVAAYCLLDRHWLTPEDSLRELHWLSKSTVYGESAKNRLKLWYNRLAEPAVSISSQTQATNRDTVQPVNPPSEITLKGCSSSLERRLKSNDIDETFSWQPEGTLSVNRYIKRKAPFSHQEADMSKKPLIGLIDAVADFREVFDKCRGLALPALSAEPVAENCHIKEERINILVGNLDMAFYEGPYDIPHTLEGIKKLANECVESLERKQFEEKIERIAKSGHCLDESKFKRKCLAAFDEYHHPLKAPIDAISLAPALYYSFLEYFCEQTGAANGHLKIFHASTENRYTGWIQAETPETLYRSLLSLSASTESKLIEGEHLKAVGENPDLLIIKPDELKRYFLEFYESLNIDKMIREGRLF